MYKGSHTKLQHVRYAHYHKWNLISIGSLDYHGCVVNIENNIIKVINGAMTLIKVFIKNGLYDLH